MKEGGGNQIPSAVFRVWRNRQRIEIEAARLFSLLAEEIEGWRGPEDPVAILARQAAKDEMRHELLCREILALSSEPLELGVPGAYRLGAKEFSVAKHVLYASVAIGCVTETLSTALLIEMRKRALPGLIRDTVHEILEDEVDHSRIGWAELALQSKHSDVTWLAAYVPSMIEDALNGEIDAMLDSDSSKLDLSPWGILPAKEAQRIMQETLVIVVRPGLARFGIHI